MNVTSYHPPTYRNFDYLTPDETGIGGSETAVVQMSQRLARRGHDVQVYAPVPEGPGMQRLGPGGERWSDCQDVDVSREGVWIINRCPEILDYFPADHPNQKLWFLSEDVWYETLTPERAAKLDRYICLCESHAWTIRTRFPYLADKVCVGANGIRMDLIRALEKDPPVRNPRKLVFASSPDRGLLPLLRIFRRAKEWIHDLQLVACYGFDNIDVIIESQGQCSPQRILKEEIMREMDQPGVMWHGRTSQRDLYRHWLSAGLWVHPSNFTETNCITCQDAQAMGAIPIVKPVWAIGEYVKHGVFVHGDPYSDPLVIARFVMEIFRLVSKPGLQDQIRAEMMPYARERFNWERSIDQLESWMLELDHHPMMIAQYSFQQKHAVGDILNVGSADDASDFKGRGAVNLDVQEYDLAFQRPNKPDIVGDCRELPGLLDGRRFDTVILGEILEHFPIDEVPAILRKAKACLRPGGRIVITVPNEHRPVNMQHTWAKGDEEYIPGVAACHTHPVTLETIIWWMTQAGLEAEVIQEIDYSHFVGHGVVAVPSPTLDAIERIQLGVRETKEMERPYWVGMDLASGPDRTVTAVMDQEGKVVDEEPFF